MPGQPQVLGSCWFDVTEMGVTEPSGAFTPSTIIPRNGEFTLACRFSIREIFGVTLNDDPPLGGDPIYEYNVTYYAERIGPGPDYKFPPGPQAVTLAIPCIRGQYAYGPPQTEFTVSPNTMQPGDYQLSCHVKMSPVGGGSTGTPWHVAGFVQGPMINIYQP